MSKRAYFAQYTSPNIIIVPTVSFSPPRAEETETAANITFFNCERRTEGISKTNGVNVNYHNLKEIVVEPNSVGCDWSAGASVYPESQTFKQQDSDAMEYPSHATNASQGIKEISSSLYKSRNNLVDLTGFNIQKRDCISSTKNKNDPNMKDRPQRTEITEDSQSKGEVDKKVSKAKESTETHVSGETSITNPQSNEPKQRTNDMKDTMKKYFRHLWKRNMDKKLVKLKPEKEPKCNRPKENSKDLTLPCQSKVKLKKDNSDTKIESKTKDLKRRSEFKRKYKSEYKPSETKSSMSANKKTSSSSASHNHKPNLSSEDIKRYKDFQLFSQRNNENMPKSEKRSEQKCIKLNKVGVTKKKSARKQIVQPEVASKEEKASNTKEIINAVRNNNDIVLGKNTKEKQDIRPKQSRKRPGSYLKTEQDNYVISLEQGVKLNPKTLTKYVAPVKKSKPKKCKRIKLVINIECPSSEDSDQSEIGIEYSQPSPQDLTFLDDFNIDEIVDSLNSCRDTVECNNITTPIIEDTKTNNQISKTLVTKEKLIKVRTDIKKEEVIIIHSDSENDESESGKGFDATQNDCVKTMEICSNKPDKSSIINKESNNCKNKISRQLSRSDKCLKKSDVKGTKQEVCFKTKKTFTKSKQSIKVKIPLQNNNEQFHKLSKSVNDIVKKGMICSEKISKFSRNNNKDISPKTILHRDMHRTHENESINKFNEDIKLTKICSQNKKDEIETSLETMFNGVETKCENNRDSDPSNVLNTYITTKPEIILLESDDIIEKSLKTMFNSTEDSEDTQICGKPSNPDEYFVKQEIIPLKNLEDNIVESLEISSDIKQCVETKKDSASVNVIDKKQTLKTTFSSTEDRKDIQNDVKPVIDEYLVKEETISLRISASEVTETHKVLSDVNHNFETKMDIAPLNTNTKNINEVDTLQKSSDNNLPRNTIDKESLNVNEKADNTVKNMVKINIEMTKINNNNSLQGSKQEEENVNTKLCTDIFKQSINVLQTDFEDSQPKANIKINNNFNTSNIETVDLEQKIENSIELIESRERICTGNDEIQIDTSTQTTKTTVDEAKIETKITSDTDEQDKNIALKTNETVTEASLNEAKSPNFDDKLAAQITPVKTISERKYKAININKHSSFKKEGLNKIYTKFNTEEGQVKSAVTVNNTTNSKANNNITIQNDVFKTDAPLVGNSHSNIENYEEPMTSKQFMENLETRMFEHLHATFKLSSIIHNGYFSVIYKCKDKEDVPYAVKVFKNPDARKAHVIARMLRKVQNYTFIENSSVLFMIKDFGVGDNWCFLTEYYTSNLKQALIANKRTFHINAVQKLASQLIAAVSMLTKNNIIHTDIKPEHVLLNASNSKLKLCGFDKFIYRDKAVFLPNTGTASYRAPELILGYSADYRIDVWATALVMFEMATSIKLFPGSFNNEILYKQMCALGSFDSDMINASKFKYRYFSGTSFIKKFGWNGQNTMLVHTMHRNENLESEIYMAYRLNWEQCRSKWQVTEDLDKLERFHALLKQMLVLDPRYRLPIHFIGASEFFHDYN